MTYFKVYRIFDSFLRYLSGRQCTWDPDGLFFTFLQGQFNNGGICSFRALPVGVRRDNKGLHTRYLQPEHATPVLGLQDVSHFVSLFKYIHGRLAYYVVDAPSIVDKIYLA